MYLHYFPPSPALREYVRLFQIVHLVFPAGAVLPFKPYWPRPEQCLAFSTRQTERVEFMDSGKQVRKPRSALIGQPALVTNRYVGQELLLFQVVFQPGALFRLTGVSAHELTNTLVDAEAVFSTEIRLVNERLSSTDNYAEMTGIVEGFIDYLIKRRSAPLSRFGMRPIDKISQLLLQNPTVASLDWMADQACLSHRQFYRQFVAREGISPKLYARIARFNNAMKLKNAQPSKDWLSVAIDLGYYDYQHLVRDFKEFTHLTPNEFLAQENRAPERTFGKIET